MFVAKKLTYVALLLAANGAAHAGTVLDKVKAAHSLSCGVMKEEEDYSRAEDHGNRAAFDLDMCKAVAVAILGPGAQFVIKAYPDEPAGVKGIENGEVELLASASPTVRNETTAGLGFTRPTFYDGQGFLVLKSANVHSARDLAGKKICFVIESQSEVGLRTYAARQHITYIWYPFSEAGEMEAAFFTNNCAAITGDVSQLANTRAIYKARAAEFTILPDTIRKDPLAAAYRLGDPQFAAIVNWTVESLIEAEELGVTRANVESMKKSPDAEVQELPGRPLGAGALLGLETDWAAHVIEAVGNYGEMFERDLGAGSPLRLDRGANRLWTDGGQMYALPVGSQ